MKIIDIQFLWLKLGVLRPYLPKRMFSYLKRMIQKPGPTTKQLSELTRLGESIGLERNEVIAAIDASLSDQKPSASGRPPMVITILVFTIAVAILVLSILIVTDPDFPIHVYAPGTYYGTIRPQDFSS